MKLFDIVGGELTIHADALGLPCFRRFWEKNKNKKHATDVISYIVLMHKWDSPYVQSMDENTRKEKLKEKLFGDANYKLGVKE